MTSDERDSSAFEALIGKLRETIGQQVQTVLDELHAAALADRDRSIADARGEAERVAADRLAADVAAAEARAREAAHGEGYALGKDHGYSSGKDEGFAAGKDEGLSSGRSEGFAAGKAEGFNEGRNEGFNDGKTEGFVAGREEGFTAGKDEGYATGKEHGFLAGAEDARAQMPPVAPVAAFDSGVTDRLADGVRSIGRARSLSEILDALVGAIGREATRSALFLVRGEQFRAWRLLGFGRLDDDSSLAFPFSEAGILADAVKTNAVAIGQLGRTAPTFASLEAGRPCVAIPIPLSGEVVAVLYADQDSAPLNAAPIEVLTNHAARSLEAMTAFKAARAIMSQPDACRTGCRRSLFNISCRRRTRRGRRRLGTTVRPAAGVGNQAVSRGRGSRGPPRRRPRPAVRQRNRAGARAVRTAGAAAGACARRLFSRRAGADARQR